MIAKADSNISKSQRLIGVLIGQRRHHLGAVGSRLPKVGRAIEQEEHDEDASRAEGEELDHRFHRDRQDQPVLMFGRVGMAGAEHDGESRQATA